MCVSGNAAGMGKCKNGVELLNGDKIEVVDKWIEVKDKFFACCASFIYF